MSFTVKVKEELLSLASRDKNELVSHDQDAPAVWAGQQWFDPVCHNRKCHKIARHLYELLSTSIRSSQKSVTIRRPTCARMIYIVFLDQSGRNPSDLHLADSLVLRPD